MHILHVQFCILAELYRRVGSSVPEQREEAPRRPSGCSLQELLPWGHDGRAAPEDSHPVPWDRASCAQGSWASFFLTLPSHYLWAPLSSIRIQHLEFWSIQTKIHKILRGFFAVLTCVFHLSNLLSWCAVLFILPWPFSLENGHASIRFKRKGLSDIILLKGTKTDPAHFNLPGNHIIFWVNRANCVL